MTDDREILSGGHASGQVVRIGRTVRKPWQPTTPHMIAYLEHLAAAGVDVPRVHGRHEEGRVVLDFIPGELAIERAPVDMTTVRRVGALVRRIHDESATFAVPPAWPVLLPTRDPDLVCHNDLATWNLIVDGERLVVIDWDGAGPSTRLWDLAYSALSFAHLVPGADVTACGERLRSFVDGYGADAELRESLPRTLEDRARAMADHLRRSHAAGDEPWATMFVEGHGQHWDGVTRFVAQHRETWARSLRA